MEETRLNILEKITKKNKGLRESLQLLLDAEMSRITQEGEGIEIAEAMTAALNWMKKAEAALSIAKAAAEGKDMDGQILGQMKADMERMEDAGVQED